MYMTPGYVDIDPVRICSNHRRVNMDNVHAYMDHGHIYMKRNKLIIMYLCQYIWMLSRYIQTNVHCDMAPVHVHVDKQRPWTSIKVPSAGIWTMEK